MTTAPELEIDKQWHVIFRRPGNLRGIRVTIIGSFTPLSLRNTSVMVARLPPRLHAVKVVYIARYLKITMRGDRTR